MLSESTSTVAAAFHPGFNRDFLLPSVSIKPGSGCALLPCREVALLVPNLGATKVSVTPELGLASLLHLHPGAKAPGCDEPAAAALGRAKGSRSHWGVLFNIKLWEITCPSHFVPSMEPVLCVVCWSQHSDFVSVSKHWQEPQTVRGQSHECPATP